MNETIKEGNSAYAHDITKPRKAMKLVMDRMAQLRPRREVQLKPYWRQPMYSQQGLFGAVKLDMNAGYPQAELGDVAYAASWLWAEQEAEAVINLRGRGCIWLGEECIYDREESGSWTIIPVKLARGKNELLARCTKLEEGWGIELYVSCPRYPSMWARDYLLNVRCTLPFAQMEGLEGFAFLGAFPQASSPRGKIPIEYSGFHTASGNYHWSPTWKEGKEKEADFLWMYKDASPFCVYALTYCDTEEGKGYLLELECQGSFRIFLDGEWVCQSTHTGKCRFRIDGNGKTRQLLVKTAGAGESYTLKGRIYREDCSETAIQRIPFLKKGRDSQAEWIYVGPFRENGDMEPELLLDIPFAPEREIQFKMPYPLGNFEKGFWRMSGNDVYIRPYLDTIFFGQWFYAVQVGLYGLFVAARALKNQEGIQYFLDSIQVMADYFDYSLWDKRQFGCPAMLPRACELTELDPCGTIGVSMIEAYLHTGNEMELRVIRMLAEIVMDRLLKFEDDTYYRGSTMWADDFYMSCPFLVRAARLTGEEKYAERAMAQVRGFVKRLYMPDKRLFSHIYFTEEACPNRIPWGRGNGWVAVALTELLLFLEDTEQREEVLQIYREFMEGVLSVQDGDGMWHQILDMPETYEETSCTGMFLLSFARGIKNGWLKEESYGGAVSRAWNALLQKSIDKDGNVYGVCMGSGCSMEPSYYSDIPTHKNDDHGTGILLMAAAELMTLLEG